MATTNPTARNDGISRQRSGDSIFVHDSQNSRYFELNATAARVYELCDGSRSVAEIAEVLSAAGGEDTEALTFAALAHLDKAGLTEAPTAQASEYSRRRFAASVITPLVLSVTAHAAGPPSSPLDAGPGPTDGGADGMPLTADANPGPPPDGFGADGMMTFDGGPGPMDPGPPGGDGGAMFDAGGTPPDNGFGGGDGGT